MKQHYIPRCYLRRFSDNQNSIWTYDKVLSKSYNAPLMSVCCKDDLYTISDNIVENSQQLNADKLTPLSVEKDHFAEFVEPHLLETLNAIDGIKDEWVSGKDKYILNIGEKTELAYHIVTQFFRMPEVCDATVDNTQRWEQASVDMLKYIMAAETGNEGFKDLEVEVKITDKAALHAQETFLDTKQLEYFANRLASNIWIFRVAQNHEFYTSDFPVVVDAHVENVKPECMGLDQYGGELTYPLSPDIVLSIYDNNYFGSMNKWDCHFIKAEDKEIRRQNMLRYFYASRHVFSFTNDFSLISTIYAINGNNHIFYHPNLRAEIVSGLGRY